MIRYRDGMTEAEERALLSSIEEMDAAYARAAVEVPLIDEEDEAAEEAAFYEELRKEFSSRSKRD